MHHLRQEACSFTLAINGVCSPWIPTLIHLQDFSIADTKHQCVTKSPSLKWIWHWRLEWAIAVGLIKIKNKKVDKKKEWRKNHSFPTLLKNIKKKGKEIEKFGGKKRKKKEREDYWAWCCNMLFSVFSGFKLVLSFTLFCCESFTGYILCFILFVFKHRSHLFTELYRRNTALKTKLWENQQLYKE